MPKLRRNRLSVFRNEQDLEHTVEEFIGSLAGYQADAIPVDEINATTQNLTYVARNEKGQALMGQDPHWDHERVFEGYVRAPLDKKAKDFGFVWSEHIYNVNPLAGTGTDNISLLAGGVEQQLSEMNLLPSISAQQGNPFQNTVTNVLDPADINDVLHCEQKTKEALEEIRAAATYRVDTGEKVDPGKSIEVGEKVFTGGAKSDKKGDLGGQTLIQDKNRLKSQGFQMVNDPAGRHEVFTHEGEPIQYYLDGSIAQAQKIEQDALDTEPLDDEYLPVEWLNWHGYGLPFQQTARFGKSKAVHGELDELHEHLISNNVFQNYLTAAHQQAADKYTMHDIKTKQMFIDYERPFDNLPILFWDASDSHQMSVENATQMFDLARLK